MIEGRRSIASLFYWQLAQLSLLVVIGFIENKLIFKPNKVDHGGLSDIPHERFRFGYEFGLDLDGIFSAAKSNQALLFIHGNRHNLTKFSDHYRLFAALGVSFFAFDYPGYGTSAGAPSEMALYASARAALAQLSTRFKFPYGQIVVYGCSLGGAVASELVQSVPVGGLITESTFTNSREVAQHLYPFFPLWLFTPTRFRNDERFARLRVPVLMVHGDRDSVVPVSMARELYERIPSKKQLSIIEGADHINSLTIGSHSLRHTIQQFLHNSTGDTSPV